MGSATDNLKGLLQSVSPFSDADLGKITECFSTVRVVKNQIILKGGDVCDWFYFVNAGCLRTYFLTNGAEKTRLILPSFSIGTALSSFINQVPSFEFIDALRDSEILKISRSAFTRLNAELPSWRGFYQKILEMAYTFQNQKIEDLTTLTAGQRYEKLRQANPQLLQVVSNKILASYLDMAPETLSRLRAARS